MLIKPNIVAVLLLTGVLSACATAPHRPAHATDPNAPSLTGRAIAAREVDFFIGDVQATGTAYRIEPVDAPGTAVTVLGGADCPQRDGKVYDIWLSREKLGFIQNTDPAFMTELNITKCQLAQDAAPQVSWVDR